MGYGQSEADDLGLLREPGALPRGKTGLRLHAVFFLVQRTQEEEFSKRHLSLAWWHRSHEARSLWLPGLFVAAGIAKEPSTRLMLPTACVMISCDLWGLPTIARFPDWGKNLMPEKRAVGPTQRRCPKSALSITSRSANSNSDLLISV